MEDITQYEQIALQYAPVILAVICYIRRNDIFVTPAKLEEKFTLLKTEIEEKLEEKYATKEFVNELKEDIKEIKAQLSTLSNYLMTQK